jgi:hypothetical protein
MKRFAALLLACLLPFVSSAQQITAPPVAARA